MINSDKLKGLMREKRVTQEKLAKVLGISQCSCNLKINNQRAFSLDEANKVSTFLEIQASEFGAYFFN